MSEPVVQLEGAAPPVDRSEIDTESIRANDWPERSLQDLTGERKDGFQVVVRQAVLDAIRRHGAANIKVEVCGVLVGQVHRDAHGPYLLIHACIAGAAATSHAANVTFTAKTWAAIHDQMDRHYPDDKIVGWYHTHPAFGIFLSEMDVFVQANFFNLPWQVAFVHDPVGLDEGMFIWRQGTPVREPILVEADPPGTQLPAAEPALDLTDRSGAAFRVVLIAFIAILAAVLVVWEIGILKNVVPTRPAPPSAPRLMDGR